jgi:hypothetical protein
VGRLGGVWLIQKERLGISLSFLEINVPLSSTCR